MQKYNFLNDIKKYKKWQKYMIEGFFVNEKDFFFDEYGIVELKTILKYCNKVLKAKDLKDFEYILKKGDISLKYKGHIVVGSFFGYTLDNIINIFLGYRKDIDIITLKTKNRKIMLMPNQMILTNSGYKKAKDITKSDELTFLLGNSYIYKKYRYKLEEKKLTIEQILLEVENIIKENNDVLPNIENIKNNDIKKHFYYLGIDTNQKFTLEDFYQIKERITKSSKKSLEEIFEMNKETKFHGNEKVITIEKTKETGYIANYISSISENIIINNFLIKQM